MAVPDTVPSAQVSLLTGTPDLPVVNAVRTAGPDSRSFQ